MILARCRGETPDGAVAEIEAIIGSTPYPGIAVENDLTISGNPTITGPCGGAHANDDLTLTGGSTVVEQYISASDQVSGSATKPGGGATPKLQSQPPVDIPAINPLDHCGTADYRLRADGYIVVTATGQVLDARSNEVFGWKRSSSSPVKWDLAGNNSVDGTVCAEGNVVVSGNTGSAANPRKMSLVATGSVEISGNPVMVPEDDDGIMIIAGGDVSISGNPSGGSNNYSGLIYAGAQCKISGNPAIGGQVLCDDKSNPAGSIQFADKNEISGNPTIRYDCHGNLLNKRRILSWYQRIGT